MRNLEDSEVRIRVKKTVFYHKFLFSQKITAQILVFKQIFQRTSTIPIKNKEKKAEKNKEKQRKSKSKKKEAEKKEAKNLKKAKEKK